MDVTIECEGLAHPEGPALLPDARLVFVETFRGQISQWQRDSGVRPYALCGGAPNACAVGEDGVYLTQMGGEGHPSRPTAKIPPSIQRVAWNGEIHTIVDTIEGRALRAPNDLCFGPRGNLCFTDPGDFNPAAPEDGYVISLLPNGSVEYALNVGPVFPNGIIALADDSVLWVESYTRRAMRRQANGQVAYVATLPEGHMPDGFKASVDGNLYITSISSGGVDVIGLDGTPKPFLATGGEPLNCLFVGTSLYITDGGLIPYTDPASRTANSGRLLRVGLGVEGEALFRGRIDRV